MLCGLLPSVLMSVVILTTPGAFAYRHVGILLVGAIACGVGVEPALEWLRGRRLAVVAIALTLLVPVAAGIYYMQRAHREAGSWARVTLAAMPHNGTILAAWPALAPLRGVQALDHYRRDVKVLEAAGDPWDTGDWYKHPHAWAVAVQENRTPVPGTEQVTPTAGLNVKGLSGLVMGPVRIGYPLAWARTLRPTGTVTFKPPQ
jgi:hypothetical protein